MIAEDWDSLFVNLFRPPVTLAIHSRMQHVQVPKAVKVMPKEIAVALVAGDAPSGKGPDSRSFPASNVIKSSIGNQDPRIDGTLALQTVRFDHSGPKAMASLVSASPAEC